MFTLDAFSIIACVRFTILLERDKCMFKVFGDVLKKYSFFNFKINNLKAKKKYFVLSLFSKLAFESLSTLFSLFVITY